jgi:hypothetical protein
VVGALGREKFRNCGARFGIVSRDHYSATARQIFVSVCDCRALRGHDPGARHVAFVNERRCAEVTGLEGVLNETHVSADLGYTD